MRGMCVACWQRGVYTKLCSIAFILTFSHFQTPKQQPLQQRRQLQRRLQLLILKDVENFLGISDNDLTGAPHRHVTRPSYLCSLVFVVCCLHWLACSAVSLVVIVLLWLLLLLWLLFWSLSHLLLSYNCAAAWYNVQRLSIRDVP